MVVVGLIVLVIGQWLRKRIYKLVSLNIKVHQIALLPQSPRFAYAKSVSEGVPDVRMRINLNEHTHWLEGTGNPVATRSKSR